MGGLRSNGGNRLPSGFLQVDYSMTTGIFRPGISNDLRSAARSTEISCRFENCETLRSRTIPGYTALITQHIFEHLIRLKWHLAKDIERPFI